MSFFQVNELSIIGFCQFFESWVTMKTQEKSYLIRAFNFVQKENFYDSEESRDNINFYKSSGFADYMSQVGTAIPLPLVNTLYANCLCPVVINAKLKVPVIASSDYYLSGKTLLLPPHPNLLQAEMTKMGDAMVYLVDEDDFYVCDLDELTKKIQNSGILQPYLLARLFRELLDVVKHCHASNLSVQPSLLSKAIQVNLKDVDLSQLITQGENKGKIVLWPFISGFSVHSSGTLRYREYGEVWEISMKQDYENLYKIFYRFWELDEKNVFRNLTKDVELELQKLMDGNIVVDDGKVVDEYNFPGRSVPEINVDDAKSVVEQIKEKLNIGENGTLGRRSVYTISLFLELFISRKVLGDQTPGGGLPSPQGARFQYMRKPISYYLPTQEAINFISAIFSKYGYTLLTAYESFRQEVKNHDLNTEDIERGNGTDITDFYKYVSEAPEPVETSAKSEVQLGLFRTIDLLQLRMGLSPRPIKTFLETPEGKRSSDILLKDFKNKPAPWIIFEWKYKLAAKKQNSPV